MDKVAYKLNILKKRKKNDLKTFKLKYAKINFSLD